MIASSVGNHGLAPAEHLDGKGPVVDAHVDVTGARHRPGGGGRPAVHHRAIAGVVREHARPRVPERRHSRGRDADAEGARGLADRSAQTGQVVLEFPKRPADARGRLHLERHQFRMHAAATAAAPGEA